MLFEPKVENSRTADPSDRGRTVALTSYHQFENRQRAAQGPATSRLQPPSNLRL